MWVYSALLGATFLLSGIGFTMLRRFTPLDPAVENWGRLLAASLYSHLGFTSLSASALLFFSSAAAFGSRNQNLVWYACALLVFGGAILASQAQDHRAIVRRIGAAARQNDVSPDAHRGLEILSRLAVPAPPLAVIAGLFIVLKA